MEVLDCHDKKKPSERKNPEKLQMKQKIKEAKQDFWE